MAENEVHENKINIFILAAGLGERLRPVTNHIPKPLVPVLGKPALQYILDKVAKLPYIKIGINVYYKKGLIEGWVSQCSMSDRITLFREEDVLGTGGAIKNAGDFLNSGTFLVYNSDILSDINLEELIENHRSSGNLATLAVHDHPEYNCLVIDEKGLLSGVEKERIEGQNRLKAFTGIAVYEPEFLKFLPLGKSSVVDAWLKAVSAGYKLGVFDVAGCYWNDIGTPSAYAGAVFDKLRAEGETVYVHPALEKCIDADIQGHVVIEEGCELPMPVSLMNCILLPGCVLSPRSSLIKGEGSGGDNATPLLKNCIIGPDFKIDLDEKDILDFDNDGRQLIGTGGSDRRYYRIKKGEDSVVLMQCGSDDPDFERQIEYTRFFMDRDVPVPGLINVKTEKRQAVFEDAGDVSLYSHMKCPRESEEIEEVYKKVVDVMIGFHSGATGHVSDCPLLHGRIFDNEYFRWETEYFIERFVEGRGNMILSNKRELEKELDALALKAGSFPKTIIHRDFQSQNIMIMKGRELRVIDFQGARIGPPAYDAASILWDPYCRIEDGLRERLMQYYIKQMNDDTDNKFEGDLFRDALVTCRLQRHMQALGAYGFLSSVKGKSYFLKYVPEGLRLLKEDISLSSNEYPELYELIMKL